MMPHFFRFTTITTVALLHFFSAPRADAAFPTDFESPLTRIALGSCNHQILSQRYFETIQKTQPQLWLWLGDTIYADKFSPTKRAQTFTKMKVDNEHYSEFVQKIPIMGTWDDHDFYDNNSDGSYEFKAQSQQVFLDFLDFPRNHPTRSQQGLYYAMTFGPQGKRVRVIMTDSRYDRTPMGPSGVMFSPAQWAWLERTMARDPVELTILAMSTQAISNEHRGEALGYYGREREKLFDLIDQTKGTVLIVSGDRHFGEFSRTSLPSGRSLFELTASGLTHSSPRRADQRNPHRVGRPLKERNFGLIEIDWDKPKPEITLRAMKINGKQGLEQRLELTRP